MFLLILLVNLQHGMIKMVKIEIIDENIVIDVIQKLENFL